MAKPRKHLNQETPPVLVTGANGRIGTSFARHAKNTYPLRLLVREEKDSAALQKFGEVVVGDLINEGVAERACRGVDTVVHLAADPSPEAEWDSLRPNNIIAPYNVLTAAAAAGCRRVIFASSIHAVSGYPKGYQVHVDDPVNPGDLYGVSKCFGEALARYMTTQKGLSCIVLRIGAFQTREWAESPEAIDMMDAFVSHRDLNQLICRCIDCQNVDFAIFHALSDNRFNRMDITTAKQTVGYHPHDDFTEVNRELASLELSERVTPHDERH